MDDFSLDDLLLDTIESDTFEPVPEPDLSEPEPDGIPTLPEADDSDVARLQDYIAMGTGEPIDEPMDEPISEPDAPNPDDWGLSNGSDREPWYRRVRAHPQFAAGLVATLLIVGGATAALLFAQTLSPPTVTLNTLSRNCDPVSPTPASVIKGTFGFVTWQCSATTGAIQVNGAGTVTPTVTKGDEWDTNLFIYKLGGTPPSTSCGIANPSKIVTPGVPMAFVSGDAGGWGYCNHFSDAPDPMTAITVSWSQ
jgi:hypothetical protein